MFFALPLLLLSAGLVSSQYQVPFLEQEKTPEYWMKNMQEELTKAKNRHINTRIAKNIIIFVGDGMGIAASTAGRIYKGQTKGFSGEEYSLVWEKFPHASLIKTYDLDMQVSDSASTASAIFTGMKTNFMTLGFDGRVKLFDYHLTGGEDYKISSVLKWAQDAGKDTGFVTTTRVTHATPAALYAHSAYRFWECDAQMNQTVRDFGCMDVAKQLVYDETAKNIKVIMGGGRSYLGAPKPSDKLSCERLDQINLVDEWLSDKKERMLSATYVTNTEELLNADIDNVDHIMGLFASSHTDFEVDRDKSPQGSPSLEQMTVAAIKRLQRSDSGYFLMVEGGRIDSALHASLPRVAVEEVSSFDDAISSALNMVDLEDTLVIVTADHSHVMTFNGYPERGHDILGKVVYEDTVDGLPYPTLMFTTGPGFEGTFDWNGTNVVRKDISDVDTTSKDWVAPSIVQTKDNYLATHGGEDIGTYATGPMAHLLSSVHEQPYIAHVMAYSACIGPYAKNCDRLIRYKLNLWKFLRPQL